MIARILLSTSAAITLFLGGVHLKYTAFTRKLNPVEGQLETAMRQTPMRISAQATMWNAWLGFNFSHSLGLILFGLVFGYLAIGRWEVFDRSYFLMIVGFLVLLTYVALARVFWFRAPFMLASCAMLLYVAGLVCALARV